MEWGVSSTSGAGPRLASTWKPLSDVASVQMTINWKALLQTPIIPLMETRCPRFTAWEVRITYVEAFLFGRSAEVFSSAVAIGDEGRVSIGFSSCLRYAVVLYMTTCLKGAYVLHEKIRPLSTIAWPFRHSRILFVLRLPWYLQVASWSMIEHN